MNDKQELIDSLKRVLADTFALYLKAQNYHWNVTGVLFHQLHEFFGELYENFHGAVDDIAENIRKLDSFVPGSLSKFKELTNIEDEIGYPDYREMLTTLRLDNQTVMNSIKTAQILADKADEIGLSNYLQDRYDIHSKYRWMLTSFTRVE